MQKEIFWLRNNNLSQLLLTAGVLIIPVILYLMPLEWIEDNHSICLYKNITGNECIGCGMTRAIFSAMHFRFENAYYYNKLVIIVFPLLIYIWTKTVIDRFLRHSSHFTILNSY